MLEFDFGVAGDSGYDDDHLEIGLDHYGPIEKAGGAKATAVHPYGFLSRPLDPEKGPNGEIGEGCGLLRWQMGDHFFAMPIDDPRVAKKLPKVRKGGAMVYCGAGEGSFLLFDGEDPDKKKRAGGLTVGVKYPDKTHVLTMGIRVAGEEEVSLKHGDGMGLAMNAGGLKSCVMRNAKGTAYFETNDKGNIINGKTKIQGALAVGDPTASQPVAMAIPLIAILTEICTILAATGPTAPGTAASATIPKLAALKSTMLNAL